MVMQTEYRKVLVPVDGSPSSFHALEQAFQFSSKDEEWITVACVSTSYQGDLDTLTVKDTIVARMRHACEKNLAKAREIAVAKGYLIKTVLLEEGDPSSRIVELADANDHEMIIMGRRGLSRLERVFVGSVTKRVIGHSHGDVVVVPNDVALAWNKILVATDGSACSMAAVLRALHFALAYGGEISVVSVVDVPAEAYAEIPDMTSEFSRVAMSYADEAVQLCQEKGVQATPYVIEGTTHEVIPELARTLGAQVICVGSHGRTGMSRLLLGSVAEKIIGFATCPVLVARQLES